MSFKRDYGKKNPNSKRLPPWHYRRETLPDYEALSAWRRLAREAARKVGARTACGICHRAVNQWGSVDLRHPKSYGRIRRRKTCTTCANLLIQMLDVLAWYGASDNLPPETWEDLDADFDTSLIPALPVIDTGQEPGVDYRSLPKFSLLADRGEDK